MNAVICALNRQNTANHLFERHTNAGKTKKCWKEGKSATPASLTSVEQTEDGEKIKYIDLSANIVAFISCICTFMYDFVTNNWIAVFSIYLLITYITIVSGGTFHSMARRSGWRIREWLKMRDLSIAVKFLWIQGIPFCH